MFDNVFVDRKSWLAFKESGHWPDKAVFAMEMRGAADGDGPSALLPQSAS